MPFDTEAISDLLGLCRDLVGRHSYTLVMSRAPGLALLQIAEASREVELQSSQQLHPTFKAKI